MQQMGGPQLRAAIELVSPANKDRASHCRAFAVGMGGSAAWARGAERCLLEPR